VKRTILALFSGLFIQLGFAQTVAQDWTKTDCSGNSWHLFNELNNGKVIIIIFVMPCSSCTVGAATLEQIYQEYNFNYPGRILEFAMGDNNSTPCSTLNNWNTSNGFSFTTFANCAAEVNYYGGVGMPTVVVLGGGWGHGVYYRKVSIYGPSEDANVRAAMDSALLASGVNTDPENNSVMGLFPNPASGSASLSYTLSESVDIALGIYDVVGKLVKPVFSGSQVRGNHTETLDCADLANGVYFVKLQTGEGERTVKLLVSHN
jgi:thiol-disulfide isomerase/thioredoxin